MIHEGDSLIDGVKVSELVLVDGLHHPRIGVVDGNPFSAELQLEFEGAVVLERYHLQEVSRVIDSFISTQGYLLAFHPGAILLPMFTQF